MSFSLKSIKVDPATAIDIIGKVMFFVQAVEQVAEAQTGAEKLEAVKNAVESFIKAAYPALAPSFGVFWPELAAVVNGVVALYNAIGFFKKLTGK